ncbi:hypothetical protein [Micromonospora craniellae]|uniref:Uncharacterized protein n=1 Tax=Micromonospora craniellae TaxID=2294034 RepID=A0A372G225_9ACTN|nr:hypothetical protein [Micromonospora craniellae]QOC89849.1 hypothetical protein ID554_16560 [Micromonospora craniellae]RFS46998.1 hypothetical protein D0Q02_07495 [Micromonospora craniellae]
MTGPDTGGPPSGPGIDLTVPFDEQQAARLRREAAAWGAGSKGTAAVPLTAEQREDRYRKQTRSTRLTARQGRRARHKARRYPATQG